MRTRRTVVSLALVALGAAATLPATAAAQRRARSGPADLWEEQPGLTIAVAGAGLYSSLDRAAVARDGFGFDAGTYLGVSSFALGVGYQRTLHDRGGSPGSAVYEGLFVEPRVSLPLGDVPFTPYLAGRIVRIHPFRGRATEQPTGVQLGGGAGVLVAVAPRVRLDLGASYGRLRLDDAASAVGDRTSSVTQLRAGLVVGVGRWTRAR